MCGGWGGGGVWAGSEFEGLGVSVNIYFVRFFCLFSSSRKQTNDNTIIIINIL